MKRLAIKMKREKLFPAIAHGRMPDLRAMHDRLAADNDGDRTNNGHEIAFNRNPDLNEAALGVIPRYIVEDQQ